MKCRFCSTELKYLFISLGSSPLSNSYLSKEDLNKMEPFYPLEVYVCGNCFLVQLEEFESPKKIFGEYLYFSSYSTTWLEHAKSYAEKMANEFHLNKHSLVVEIASNDGYLLQYFVEKGIPVQGIEPAVNVAEAAKKKGIPTKTEFFGIKTAEQLVAEGKRADLLLGNNVLAHVPNLNDFVEGLKIALKPDGIITMEFPHLMQLMDNTQFDTIYHEHFSYFSFITVEQVFEKHGLILFDVEEIPTHGGSLRIYACHKDDKTKEISKRVVNMKKCELKAGFASVENYLTFEERVKSLKREILNFLIKIKEDGKIVIGYGAPAKGNTLLNYCGIGTDFIDYTVDRNPYKQGRYLPCSHIPIKPPEAIKKTKPDYIIILPWNIKEEIISQMNFARKWGAKFVTLIPKVEIL